jgi:hypothetical protein
MPRSRFRKTLKLALEYFLITILSIVCLITIYYVYKLFFTRILELMLYVQS